MLYAIHCDGLVLGFGRTPRRAEADAKAHDADLDLTETCLITLEAATHVLSGGDCRALRLTRNDADPDRDFFSLAGEHP